MLKSTAPSTFQGGSNSTISRQRQGQMHSSGSTAQQYSPGERRLLVKVVRAADLAGELECREPYCVVELDEPPQRHQTSIKKETKNPVWDEAFLLYVSHALLRKKVRQFLGRFMCIILRAPHFQNFRIHINRQNK
jgi:hypothetical protein